MRRDFLLRPHWLYFSHVVRRDYLSRVNTGSTSSTPRVAATSSYGHIASTIHLDYFSKLVENGSHAPNNWSASTLTSQLQQQLSRLHRRPPRLHQQSAKAATAKSFI
jgi:hypothetical protein